jgi:ABC-type sugar transport system substrate-binding protein
MVNPTRLAAAALAAALAVTALPTAAHAANGTIGQRETVCATDLFVRTDPNGAWMGTLYRGQTFLVEGPRSGGYVYGFAYGHVNRHGWVQDGWFC